MVNNKRISVSYLLVLVILIAAIILGIYIWNTITKVEPISSDELRTKIEETYSGKVKSMIITENNEYEVEMESKDAIYAMKLDATTGKVNTMKKVSAVPIESKDNIVEEEPLLTEQEIVANVQEKFEGTVKVVAYQKMKEQYSIQVESEIEIINLVIDGKKGTIISQQITGKQITPTLISESKAIEIAQSRLSGEVEDVSFEKTNEGGYFLIEIDGDDQEAVIQVHAISGIILSVTSDD